MIYSVIGILFGIVFAFVWKAKDYIQHKMFSFPVWWKENKGRFIWAFVFGIIFGVMLDLYPSMIDALEFIGFSVETEEGNLSEVLIGLFVANATYSKSKNKEMLNSQ